MLHKSLSPNASAAISDELAALMCSKLCHDLISPIGALGNGLEVLEDENDAEMREYAMQLIANSARTASAKLQFLRVWRSVSPAVVVALWTLQKLPGLLLTTFATTKSSTGLGRQCRSQAKRTKCVLCSTFC